MHDGQLVKQINTYNNGSAKVDAAKLQFREDFKIPLAGGRNWYNAYLGGIDQTASFWSSSPYIDYDVVHFFSVGINSIAAGSTEPFANANSIRCFKNVPIISSNDNLEKK
ncbi:hypothetical protein J5751_04570 [bacterium]|nr:hypothetical protein [bacterium]